VSVANYVAPMFIGVSEANRKIMKKFKVAVVGATGAVGQEMLKMLEARDFPVSEIYALA